jgi:Xaa-Pro aminopeptidase
MNHFRQIAEKLNNYALDGMLLTGEANRFYASGFHSIATDGVALVTRGKAYYYTDSRYIEAANRYVQGAEIHMVSRGRGYAVLLEEVIRDHKLHRLGFEDATMTVADYESYRKALSCELVPATALLLELRRVKDEEELSNMVSAQRIAEKALSEIFNEIRPGVTEKELAARIQYLMLHYGAENMSFDPIVLTGKNGSLPHGVPSDDKVCNGDFVTMDFGCIYHGYCSDMTRTVAVGFATEEMQMVYSTVLAAQKAGIAAARAGISGQKIDGVARRVIANAGYGDYFGHSFGHGVGVEIHEAPNASPSNETVLSPNTVISAEPGIYLPGKMGVRIEDVIVLKENGCLNITKAPKELIIL